MTLYDLANATNVQGNIEVRIYTEIGNDVFQQFQFLDCTGLEYTHLFRGASIDGRLIADLPVKYMFAENGECEAWLIIELEAAL